MAEDSAEFSRIIKNRWYVQGFNACLNFIFHAPYSALVDCHQQAGYGYTEKLLVFNKDYVDYHYLESDLRNIGSIFLEKLKSDPDYFKEILKKDAVVVRAAAAVRDGLSRTAIASLDKREAFERYQQMWTAYHKLIGLGHLVEGVTYVLEPELKSLLEKETDLKKESKEFTAIFNALLQPERPSFVSYEQMELMRIVKLVLNDHKAAELFSRTPEEIWTRAGSSLKEAISNHRKEFFYNQINYFYGECLSELEYIREIKKFISDGVNPDVFIREERGKYKKNIAIRNNLTKKLKLSNETLSLVNLSVGILHWQDDRKKNMLSCVYYMNLLLKSLANKFNLPYEMLKTFAPTELTYDALEHFDLKEGAERLKHYAVYMEKDGDGFILKTFSGKDFEKFDRLYKKSKLSEIDIHGTSASMGRQSGIVKICMTKTDIAKVNVGDVLVTSMTRPEFVPALRKACAIITDEGGITCHAAIISRELGIPCIIGTKIATKVLKDGDVVEVNANHGIVRIIEKKK